MNYLRSLATDMWDKKLLPIVAVLVLAAVAIPVFVTKGPSQQQQSPNTSEATLPEANPTTPAVKFSEGVNTDKGVNTMTKKNPFVQQATGISSSSSSSSSSGSGSVEPVPSSGTSSTSSTGSSSSTTTGSGSSSSATTSTGSSGSTDSSTTSGSSTSDSATKKYYRWVVTVEFGTKGNEKEYKDLAALGPLPSTENPVITFIGTSKNRKAAVFLIDSNTGQKGEGDCKPSDEQCTLIYLRDDPDRNDHTVFRVPGHKYHIHLKSIDLISVPKDKA